MINISRNVFMLSPYRWLRSLTLLGIDRSGVGRFVVNRSQLPSLGRFHPGVAIDREQSDVRVRADLMGIDDGLSIVSKHFDEVLVDKDAQRQVLAVGELERRIALTDLDAVAARAGENRHRVAA